MAVVCTLRLYCRRLTDPRFLRLYLARSDWMCPQVRARLRLVAREDFAVRNVGQRLTDLVGVDGGNEGGQLA